MNNIYKLIIAFILLCQLGISSSYCESPSGKVLTKLDAEKIAKEKFAAWEKSNQLTKDSKIVYVIVPEHTIEEPWGWVFFYQSKKYIETMDERYLLLGNGPLFISKQGQIFLYGSDSDPDEFVRYFRKCLVASTFEKCGGISGN